MITNICWVLTVPGTVPNAFTSLISSSHHPWGIIIPFLFINEKTDSRSDLYKVTY